MSLFVVKPIVIHIYVGVTELSIRGKKNKEILLYVILIIPVKVGIYDLRITENTIL